MNPYATDQHRLVRGEQGPPPPPAAPTLDINQLAEQAKKRALQLDRRSDRDGRVTAGARRAAGVHGLRALIWLYVAARRHPMQLGNAC